MPQLEDGYTRIADELLEALVRTRIPGQAGQVLLFIIRKTYGFNKKEDAISLSQFESATGLNKSRICHCLTKLEGMNLITKKGNGDITIYGINKRYSSWMPLPKKVTVVKKHNQRYEKTQSALPNMGHTIKTLTKDTLTKDNIISLFESIWKMYPMKSGRKEALRHYKATVHTQADVDSCQKALSTYLAHLNLPQNRFKATMNGSTFFNNWQDWVDWVEPDAPTHEKYDPQASEQADMTKQEIRRYQESINRAKEYLAYIEQLPEDELTDTLRAEAKRYRADIARDEAEIRKLEG